MAAATLNRRWRALGTVARILRAALGWRVQVEGLEHVPRVGGAVLAFNHHSYADFVVVGWATVIELRRPLLFVGKREVFDSPWIGWLTRAFGSIPVDRGSAESRAAAFDAAVDVLRRGELMGVAPEQTVSASFELLPFRSGAVRMAQQAGVPIVPAVGWGTHRFATAGSRVRLVRKLPVTLRFGPPLHPGPDNDPVRETERLRATMAAMLDEVQRTYPDGTPPGAPWVPARLGGSAPDHDAVLAAYRRRTQGWQQDVDDTS